MKTDDKEKIRKAVREGYGKIANAGNDDSSMLQMISCCGASETSDRTSLADLCCGEPDLTPERLSALMGYTQEDMESIPHGANMGLGCGNPVALASLEEGETVVDLGCGGGFDCFLAAKQVGETGQVIGVDMTPEMVSKARKNAEKAGIKHVDFRLGEIEHLPVADNSADIIMSNCVINLSPDKLSVYREALRVLKPAGRLAVSDILATAPLPDEVRKNLALIAACIGGAATIETTEELLREAGFTEIKITPHDASRELIREWAPGKSKNAVDYIVSAYIEAVKPS
jgi:arsenite methyltransferase